MDKRFLLFLLFYASHTMMAGETPYTQKALFPENLFNKKLKKEYPAIKRSIREKNILKEYCEKRLPFNIALYEDRENGRFGTEIAQEQKETVEQIRKRTKNYTWTLRPLPVNKQNDSENEFKDILQNSGGDLNKAINQACENNYPRQEQCAQWACAQIPADSPHIAKKVTPCPEKVYNSLLSVERKSTRNHSNPFPQRIGPLRLLLSTIALYFKRLMSRH